MITFIDTETTGLDERRHEIWEFAGMKDTGETLEWAFFPNLEDADPTALKINNFYARAAAFDVEAHFNRPGDCIIKRHDDKAFFEADRFMLALETVRFIGTDHVAGMVPTFDTIRLERLIRKYGLAPVWHYHSIDIEAMAIGYMLALGTAIEPPWRSDDLSRELGVDPEKFDRHTAAGDVHWAMALYDQMTISET